MVSLKMANGTEASSGREKQMYLKSTNMCNLLVAYIL
jgi:hypothetical protein